MIECVNFRKFNKGYCLGIATIRVKKWGIEIRNISLFEKDGKRWVAFPSKEFEDEAGKKKYMPYFLFIEPSHHDVFVRKVKEAIDKWCLENISGKNEDEIKQKEFPF